MSWPLAFIITSAILFGFIFAFLLIVYLNELAREEAILKQIDTLRDKDLIGNAPLYVLTSEVAAPIKASKNKKPTKVLEASIQDNLVPKNKKNIN
jgi:hypothetical protein